VLLQGHQEQPAPRHHQKWRRSTDRLRSVPVHGLRDQRRQTGCDDVRPHHPRSFRSRDFGSVQEPHGSDASDLGRSVGQKYAPRAEHQEFPEKKSYRLEDTSVVSSVAAARPWMRGGLNFL